MCEGLRMYSTFLSWSPLPAQLHWGGTLHNALGPGEQRETWRISKTAWCTITYKTLLYSLFTHDCVDMHASNSIIKFADNTTVVGLITNSDETAYREEVRALGVI